VRQAIEVSVPSIHILRLTPKPVPFNPDFIATDGASARTTMTKPLALIEKIKITMADENEDSLADLRFGPSPLS